MKDKENKKGAASGLYICQRIITILLIVGAFFPTFNPTRVAKMISSNVSLFTSAVSYNSLTSEFARAFRMNWVNESSRCNDCIYYIGDRYHFTRRGSLYVPR